MPVAVGSVLYFPEVTTYLGSGPEALRSKSTAGKVGTVFLAFVAPAGMVAWRVESGTAETDLDSGIIKPLDFNPTTNPVNLIRGLGI
jgi:hypothetical protein